MSASSNRRPLLAAVALILLVLPAPALAYVDPGTGSFVIQGIIAALVGAGVAIRLFWHRIRGFFGGKRAADDDDDE